MNDPLVRKRFHGPIYRFSHGSHGLKNIKPNLTEAEIFGNHFLKVNFDHFDYKKLNNCSISRIVVKSRRKYGPKGMVKRNSSITTKISEVSFSP